MIDQTVSHYRIVQELGSGGMGVVYRALDVRLGREVALKFLPPAMAADPDALARFDREARLASSLNHPNICTVHDIDQHGGRPFIVMELCSGRTVKQLIRAGPVPLDQVVEVAIQTVEALDAAHHQGIVHRDIKPANLFVTVGGQVKVLDFGLAKLVRSDATAAAIDASKSDRTASPEDELTRPGVALGTVAYMSPEQALGQPLDGRSDLFSLGAVLYEMATGAPAFPGDSVGMVFDHILNRDPVPARQVNPAVPAELADLLSRVLVKNRDLRPQRAGELLRDLRHLRRSLRAPRPAASPGQGRSAGRPGAPRPLWRRRWLWVGAICVAGLAAVALATVGFLRGPEPALTERDSVLLADFRNSTGDSVFDGTLAQALGVQLSQSPFLNIVPEERVRETLRLMGRGTEERPAGDVAREVCQRLGVKAMVGGSISRLGTLYVLLVDASNCVTGASLAREQGSSERQEEVLRTLGTMASTLRTRLGESLKSVERFDVPIAQATTPSLDALKAYTLGLAQRAKGAELESIPFLERALELDPKFAAAATTLSTVYGNLNEFGKGEEYARLAYGNSAHVSERERLFITYQYHDRVTGDQVQAADTLEVWKQTYPGDFRPPNALSILYNRLGRFDRGVAEGQEALRRSPGHPFALSNLAYAYRGLGRFADAKKTAEEAVALGVATVPTRRLLYQLAVLEGDMAAAERHVAWAKEKPREFDLMSAQAQIAAYQGRMGASTELYRTSVELAERQGLSESTSAYLAHQALGHVLYGDRLRASAFGRAALRSGRESSATSIPRLRAVIALGLLDDPEVAPILRSAEERYPQSTFTRAMLVPTSLAAIELARGRPDAALDALNAAAPYETGTVAALIPVYLRGLAYLARGAGAPALEQFQKILDHRGTDPFSPVCALAYLGRARAWRLMGDHGASARAYAEFLALWEHADPDIPVLVQARKEYERLGPPTH